MKRRKMTRGEAETLGLEHYREYYEFGSDGSAVSLRSGMPLKISADSGCVALSGRIFCATANLMHVLAVMYIGIPGELGKLMITPFNDSRRDCRAENIRIETKDEYYERRRLENLGRPKPEPEPKRTKAQNRYETINEMYKVWRRSGGSANPHESDNFPITV